MQVNGLSWLGLRTIQFEEMVTFFRDVMGMQPIRAGDPQRLFPSEDARTAVPRSGTYFCQHGDLITIRFEDTAIDRCESPRRRF